MTVLLNKPCGPLAQLLDPSQLVAVVVATHDTRPVWWLLFLFDSCLVLHGGGQSCKVQAFSWTVIILLIWH